MKKLFYVMLLAAGMSFAASNVTIAQNQNTKVKAGCCQKAAANANMKSANCPMAAKNGCPKANCPKDCPMAGKKDCPKAAGKSCPKANCPMKQGTTAGKKTGSPVAEAKVK